MAVDTINFTTGPSTLPDVGTLSYNGCTFSALFSTTMSGTAVQDAAQRTVKLMEYTLEADGYVTSSTAMANLSKMLTAQGATLVYRGRGFDFSVNAAGAGNAVNGTAADLAWGPVPKLIEFQPLGGSTCAKVKWSVTFRLSHLPANPFAVNATPLLQFNYETSLTYGEDYFSTISIRGVMEIPMTRASQSDRTLRTTVDAMRSELDSRIFSGIELAKFRVTRRNYAISRDKRTMEFDVEVEEKPYMDLPPSCTIAHGSFSFRPAKAGMGLCTWLCTLRATYNVAANATKRNAWWAFLALLRLRMSYASADYVPKFMDADPNPGAGVIKTTVAAATTGAWSLPSASQFGVQLGGGGAAKKPLDPNEGRTAWLVDFSADEGLYLDSKTITFSASWRLNCLFDYILLGSGLWRKVEEKQQLGGNLRVNRWAFSMSDVSGSNSWLPNKLDPTRDIIVDFGGG